MSETETTRPALVIYYDEEATRRGHRVAWADGPDWAGQWHGACSNCGAALSVAPSSRGAWGDAIERDCPQAGVDRSPEAVTTWQETHSASGINIDDVNYPPVELVEEGVSE